MNVEVVEVSRIDTEEWREVVSWVYSRKPPDPEQSNPAEGETRYLARVGGKPAGACSVHDFTVARGSADLRCGGVAAVATLTEYRRQGVADAVMRSVLAGMHAHGFAISALYPYRETYYRRFGYETCGWRWQIKCPQGRLPNLKPTLPLRRIEPSEITTLNGVYLEFIRSRSGSTLRTDADWTNRLGKRLPMVYAIGDPVEAYLWVSLEDFWGEANVGEIAWTTRAGYETALSLIASVCSNQTGAVWTEPPDSPYLSSYLDQGASATVNRATMFRIIDLPGAFTALKPSSSGSFCVEVLDPDCPWNAGSWQVDFSPGGVEVKPGGSAGLRTTIGHLSQALMGQPSLEQLVREGRVDVLDPSALEPASRLLEPLPVVCMEFF